MRFLSKKQFFIAGFFSLWAFVIFANNRHTHLELFIEALHSIKNNYMTPISFERLIQGAVKGMILELDPHSQFLTKEDLKGLSNKIKGESYGLGLELERDQEALIVMSVFHRSPAEQAGLLPGDQIIKIENQITKNMSVNDFKKLFQKVRDYHFIVLRDKQFLQFKLRPRPIKIKTTQIKKLEDNIFYLKIHRFSFNTSFEIRKSLKNKKINGLILDLRNNPGGVLDEAVKSTDLFLSEGLIVSYKIKNQEEKKFYAKQSQNLGSFPMVLLLNEFSASGSEVMAGALKHHKRAVIMGQKSFGKGLMQNVFPLKNQHALSLTVAEYKSPNGKSIHNKGITPDIILPKKELEKNISKDIEILTALKTLKKIRL